MVSFVLGHDLADPFGVVAGSDVPSNFAFGGTRNSFRTCAITRAFGVVTDVVDGVANDFGANQVVECCLVGSFVHQLLVERLVFDRGLAVKFVFALLTEDRHLSV